LYTAVLLELGFNRWLITKDKEIGPKSFIESLPMRRRQMTAERALLSLEARKRQATKASIFVKPAAGERAGGWEYFRGRKRWWACPLAANPTLWCYRSAGGRKGWAS
jgi:hypothetical protein